MLFGTQRLTLGGVGDAQCGVRPCSLDGCQHQAVTDRDVGLASAGMLSPDGRAKTFDERANGYIRCDGLPATVLSSTGKHSAMYVASAVGGDGKSASLTAPNGSAQKLVLKAAMKRAGLDADEIGCLQAQGLGSALGDPTEVGAVMQVLGGDRDTALTLGSHKANFGHAEAPSGLMGLLCSWEVVQSKASFGNMQLRILHSFLSQIFADRHRRHACPRSSLLAAPWARAA